MVFLKLHLLVDGEKTFNPKVALFPPSIKASSSLIDMLMTIFLTLNFT